MWYNRRSNTEIVMCHIFSWVTSMVRPGPSNTMPYLDSGFNTLPILHSGINPMPFLRPRTNIAELPCTEMLPWHCPIPDHLRHAAICASACLRRALLHEL